MNRIVVGVDGSDASLAALGYAVQEAALRGASLHVLTVHAETQFPRAPYARPHRGPSDSTGTDLVDRAVEKSARPGVDVHEHVHGRPAARLLEAAADADLLVVGRSSEHSVLGPVARACLTHAACPVLVVGR